MSSLDTDLSNSPYFAEYERLKNYYMTLFKPGVAVQVRELNEIQLSLQDQIQMFGDNIFRAGTIISGCNFEFFPSYPYVKLADINVNEDPVDPSTYVGYQAKNSSNLQAYIVNSKVGYQSTAPNLKTLFVQYTNAGNTGNLTSFTAGDTLTIYDPAGKMFGVTVNGGGIGVSNNDTVVFVPSIEVSISSGSLANGDYITDPVYSSNVQIIAIHELEDSNNVVLDLKPRTVDLANSLANSYAWTFEAGNPITDSTSTVAATVQKVYGTGADGYIVTNGIGKITGITITERGEGYLYNPTVTVQSANNSGGIAALDLIGRTYLDQVVIPSVSQAVGNGYAFGVDAGIIYQKGYFISVDKQIVVVNAYSSLPNNVSVGFETVEDIINHSVDSNLVDNALGSRNETAPGADRLKLTPTLVVCNTADIASNSEFFALVSWNDGNPYRQNQYTEYSKIGDNIAQRTYDISGNFVIDPFLVTTKCVDTRTKEGNTYTAVVDPGTAYIKGNRVQTLRNFKIDVPKATDTVVSANHNIGINYNNYIRINEVGGLFQFSTGDTVYLYSSAKDFLSNSSLSTSGNTTPQGSWLGTARARSMVLESGYPGDATAIYRLYLFNIQMNAGKNFRNVRSVYYNGTYKGIADIVVETDPTTNTTVAAVYGANNNSLVFDTGFESVKNSNNTTYVYRTIDQTATTSNSGLLVKSIAATPSEFFPYSGSLTSSQMSELYVVPIGNTLVGYNSLTGTVSVNTTSANVVGTSTTFLTDLDAGDYIKVSNGSTNAIVQVNRVVNNTLAVLTSNCSVANGSMNYYRAFPKYVPVPFGNRTGLSANVDANTNVLTLNYGMTFVGTTSVNTAIGCNIKRTGVTSTAKTSQRQKFVMLRLANNVANTTGPWCIGVADAFRLRGVYVGNSTVNTSSTNMLRDFYIDPNNTPNYNGLSYLYKNPKSSVNLSSSSYILVNFDYFTRNDDGYFDTVSYLNTSNATQIAQLDSLALASLTTAASSWEIPEFRGPKGEQYDLIKCLDFRPSAANTVAPAANAASAPINPSATLSFGNTADPANDKKFPLPDSTVVSNIEQYKGRRDVIVVESDGNIVVKRGTAHADPEKRSLPNIDDQQSLILNELVIPPYPTLATNYSNVVNQVLLTYCNNGLSNKNRINAHSIQVVTSNSLIGELSQPRGYTAADIANLERRIRDLEYVSSLSALETDMTRKIIPSSIDGTLNRFKFGFIADDFSSELNSDVDDPQYAATLEPVNKTTITGNVTPNYYTNMCVPSKYHWQCRNKYAAPSITYTEQDLIVQDYATLANTDPIHPNCAIGNTTVITTRTTNAVYSEALITTVKSDWTSLQLSTLSGNASIYFFFPNDPFITVYQSNTKTFTYSNSEIVATTANAVALDANTVNRLLANSQTSTMWHMAQDTRSNRGVFGANQLRKSSTGWVWGSGVLRFAHDGSKGKYYKIRTVAPDSVHDRALRMYSTIEYPVDIHLNTINNPCGGTSSTKYVGIATLCSHVYGSTQLYTGGYSTKRKWRKRYGDWIDLKMLDNVISPKTGSVIYYDGVRIDYSGLKPSTTHTLYVNGVLVPNTDAKPATGRFGDPLISDNYGKLSVVYHVTDANWANNLSKSTGIQTFEITNGNDSMAVGTVEKMFREPTI